MASGADGLIIVDIGRPDAPKILGAAASEDFSSAVVLDGRFAYVADGLAGVKKIDVSDPNAPRLVSSYDTPGGGPESLRPGKDHPRRRHLFADPAEKIELSPEVSLGFSGR